MAMNENILHRKKISSGNIAISDNQGNHITYGELVGQAESMERMIPKRSLVFVLCDHKITTAEFIYELLYLKRVPLLLDSEISEEFLERLIEIYRPGYIFCASKWNLSERYSIVKKIGDVSLICTGFEGYPVHPDAALLLSTSGTTGSSKLVKLTYENLYNNSKYAIRHLDIYEGQKGITPLPLNYTYGFSFYLWHWCCGATMLMSEEPVMSKKYSDFFTENQIDHFAGIPITFQMMNKAGFWNEKKLSCLKWAMSGGAQMSVEEQKYMISTLGEKFWIGYGQTEVTCIVSATNFTDVNMKPGTIGKLFDNMHAFLDDETKELILESKSVFMGYADGREDLKLGDVNNGRLYTGDAAYIDEDGYLFLKGRIARFIKILGKRISLDDLEMILRGEYADCGFACAGTNDSLKIYVETENTPDMENEILLFLDQKMMIPRKFISVQILEHIPRNNAGKIMYRELEG